MIKMLKHEDCADNSSTLIDVDAVDEKNRTALLIAVSNGHFRVVSALLQHGADPNKRDSAGNSPLLVAIRSSDLTSVISLIRNGAVTCTLSDNDCQDAVKLAESRLGQISKANEKEDSSSANGDESEFFLNTLSILNEISSFFYRPKKQFSTEEGVVIPDNPNVENDVKSLMSFFDQCTI